MKKLVSLWSVFVVASATASAGEISSESSEQFVCRQESFQGCCSKNAGMDDLRAGLCRSGTTSARCSDRWQTSLQGRCSWNGGVASVDANGVVYCNNERAPGDPIPKCATPKT